MKQRMCITVTGKSGAMYGFDFTGDDACLDEWRADGLEIDVICNTVPAWVVSLGLTRPWVAAQDAWQFLRLW